MNKWDLLALIGAILMAGSVVLEAFKKNLEGAQNIILLDTVWPMSYVLLGVSLICIVSYLFVAGPVPAGDEKK